MDGDPPMLTAARRTRSGSLSRESPVLQTAALQPKVDQTVVQPNVEADAAIFWDYENCALPAAHALATSAASRLFDASRGLGRLAELRLYHDSDKSTLNPQHRAFLESMGYTIVDCPTSSKKEAIDKKIIVDTLMFAVARSARRQPCCVVLVTGDGDFCHMCSRLRAVGVTVVLVHPSQCSRALLGCCDRKVEWERQLLGLAAPRDGRSQGKQSGQQPAKAARSGRGGKPAGKPAGRGRGGIPSHGKGAPARSAPAGRQAGKPGTPAGISKRKGTRPNKRAKRLAQRAASAVVHTAQAATKAAAGKAKAGAASVAAHAARRRGGQRKAGGASARRAALPARSPIVMRLRPSSRASL